MGSIEPVKSGLTDYRFKFWGEEFTINPLLFAFLGIGIGVVSRAFGIGGGFLLVPAMTTLAGLPMYVAVPISLIGTCFSSVGSFIGYMMAGYLPDMTLAIAIIIGGFAGGMLGSRAQKMFSEKTLKIVLAEDSKTVSVIEEIIKEGIEGGYFHTDDPVMAANIIAFMIPFYPLRSWNFKDQYSFDRFAESTINFILDGLNVNEEYVDSIDDKIITENTEMSNV